MEPKGAQPQGDQPPIPRPVSVSQPQCMYSCPHTVLSLVRACRPATMCLLQSLPLGVPVLPRPRPLLRLSCHMQPAHPARPGRLHAAFVANVLGAAAFRGAGLAPPRWQVQWEGPAAGQVRGWCSACAPTAHPPSGPAHVCAGYGSRGGGRASATWRRQWRARTGYSAGRARPRPCRAGCLSTGPWRWVGVPLLQGPGQELFVVARLPARGRPAYACTRAVVRQGQRAQHPLCCCTDGSLLRTISALLPR